MVLAFWLWRAEPRAWVRRLGFVALAAVITQGILGGITVLWFLPPPISIAHAGLAQIVFCLTITIALVTSRGWRAEYAGASDDRVLQRVAMATTALVYVQIIAGATMRHTGSGLAIPDFPLAFGGILPTHWDAQIAIHFAHRVGALCVTAMVLATTLHVFAHQRDRRELVRPSILLLLLVATQVTLGAYVIWSGKHFVINSVHVATGAAVLATSVVLTLRAHRARFSRSTTAQARVAA
jgi:cytochrome c oxidase assembly protein subunit 15